MTRKSVSLRYLCGRTFSQQGATGRQAAKKAKRRTYIVAIQPNSIKDLSNSLLAKSAGEKAIM